MNKNNQNEELPPDVSKAELDDIKQFLALHEVKYPDQQHIQATVEAVRLQMRISASQQVSRWEQSKELLKLAASEITSLHPLYWIISTVLYIVGFVIMQLEISLEPQFTLFIIAPLPFVMGLVEVLRSRDEGMLELEQSCTYNAVSIMLAKLIIIFSYSIALNVLVALWLSEHSGLAPLWELMLLWLVPFTCVSGLALLTAIRLRGSTAIMLVTSIWISICFIIISTTNLISAIISMHAVAQLIFIGFGSCLAITQLRRLLLNVSDKKGLYEFEANH